MPLSPVPAGLHYSNTLPTQKGGGTPSPISSPGGGGGGGGGARGERGEVSVVQQPPSPTMKAAHHSLYPHHLGPAGGAAASLTRDYIQIASHNLSSDSSQSYSGNKGLEERHMDFFFFFFLKAGSKLGHICPKKHGNSLLPEKAGFEAPCLEHFSQLWE